DAQGLRDLGRCSVVVDFEEALAIIQATARTFAVPQMEQVALLDSVGRVLAQAVAADRDQPAFDRSTRDGFAVRATSATSGSTLRIAGQVRAGEVWSGEAVGEDTAVQIMTGAPLPAGADSVVMVEYA